MELQYILIGLLVLLVVVAVVLVIVFLRFSERNRFDYHRDKISINGGANVENGVVTSEGSSLMNSENMRTIMVTRSSEVFVRLIDNESGADYGVISILRPVTLGSAAGSADIKLADNTVSRYHCSLYSTHGNVYIEDLNSLNGTYVNGTRITRKTLLKAGDVIGLGNKGLVIYSV